MSHYGTTPTTIAAAILTGLSSLKMVNGGVLEGGTGCVRTIGRVEDDGDPEDIERGLTDGVPGLLLCFRGGRFAVDDTSMMVFSDELQFRILCCVGTARDLGDRFSGGQTSVALAKLPGVEDLQLWAIYFACRAARALSGVRLVRPVSHSQVQTVKPGLHVAAVDLVASRWIDTHDDATENTLLTIGICHSPTDYDDLWEEDNITPKSEWDPPGVDGGVADL